MSRLTKKDQVLLAEAYTVSLLQEKFNRLTVQQIEENLHLLSPNELEYIEEVFGGLGNLAAGVRGVGRAAKEGLKRGADAIGKAAGEGLRRGKEAVSNATKGVGRGLSSAGSQIASNVKGIASSSIEAQKAKQGGTKALEAINSLMSIMKDLKAKGLVGVEDPSQSSLAEIKDEIMNAIEGSKDNAEYNIKGGIGKGVKNAFKQGYGAGSSPQPSPQGAQATA